MNRNLTYFKKAVLFAAFYILSCTILFGQCVPSKIKNTNQKGISNFTIIGDSGSEINHDSGVEEGYADYTSHRVNVTAGNTYNFTLENDVNNGAPTASMGIWIDYDGSGNYVLAYDSGITSNNYNFSGSITLSGTPLNNAVMRVAVVYCYNNATCQTIPASPCDFKNELAEVEDYTLNFDFPNTPEAFEDDLFVEQNSSGVSNQINVGGNDNISIHRGDGDDFSISVSPVNGSITEPSDGIFEYTPNLDYVGTDSFTYSFCDSNDNCDTAVVNIIVNLGACTPISNSNGSVYITNVSLDGANASSINNSSGDDGGYGNYLNTPSVDLVAGITYTVSIVAEGAAKSRGFYIDYDQDGVFNTSNEFIRTEQDAITFTVPTDALTGTTVMRVGAAKPKWFQENSCGVDYDDQEFEDYFVNITSATPNSGTTPNPISDDSAVYPDTDGDGIPDHLDDDADNDGLLNDFENNICATNPNAKIAKSVFLHDTFGAGTDRIEINGNYSGAKTDYTFIDDGDGDVNDSSYTVNHNANVTSWASSYWYGGGDNTGDTNGRMAIFNADPVADKVFYEAEINDVVPNIDITYSFAAINLALTPNGNNPKIGVKILDTSGKIIFYDDEIAELQAFNQNNGGWQVIESNFNTSETTFTIQLINLVAGGTGNDFAIDDIKVEQHYCDSDGDGIPDYLDLDDDNDGIPNVVELHLSDTDKDATLLGDGWVDADKNGVHDSYESGVTPMDTDGDGTPDYLDLDSDNDGVFDALEYDSYGDIDITGNAVGDGNDINTGIAADGFDGDGILAILDTKDGFGTNGYPDPLDTNGDGIPDYLSPKSDGTNNDIPEIYAHLDADNDGVIDGSTDADKDGILDAFDTDTTIFGSPRALNGSYSLYFDGRNDYVEDDTFNFNGTEGTIMAFIKTEGANTSGDFPIILGKPNFYLRIFTNNVLQGYVGADHLSSTTQIEDGIWTHVAFTTKGGETKLYINGKEEASSTTFSGINDYGHFMIGSGYDPDPSLISNFFKGEIDEVRVFNAALSEETIQKMVYQELDDAKNFTHGKIIPSVIDASLSSSLQRYYKMDTYQDDKLMDITGNNNSGATIYNVKDIIFQTAPLPFVTHANKSWLTQGAWLHGHVWDIYKKDVDDTPLHKSWAIVSITHDVSITNSHSTLGLIVDENVTLTVLNDSELKNTWYLKLNGAIDLQGESQLVQTQNSTLEVGEFGSLERDQKGESNKHNYNYWSSPVHTTNPNDTIDGDETYTVGGVLLDGSDEDNPKSINFIGGYNGIKTDTSISIAEYWIWKYANNKSDSYALWQHIKSSGVIKVGEGYTMKGPGQKVIGEDQNYTFKGAPNNGEIKLTLNPDNEYLVGNPYPSAIDGHEFLEDNKDVLDGTLYFWEHYGGNSHFSRDYEGGYGVYNFSGGTPAMTGTAASEDPSHSAKPKKTPNRYIAVGQGFFVKAATPTEAEIKFENDQRIFVTESSSGSIFVKNANTKTSKQEDSKNEDIRPKIRIDYKSPKGYNRQLLTTVDEHATMGVDWGYDGLLNETNIEDMYWEVENADYVIQGIDTITEQTVLPLTVKTKSGGLIEISISALENVTDDIPVYLKDYDTYYDLKAGSFFATVTSGLISDRFAIAFSNNENTLDLVEEKVKSLGLFYNKNNTSIIINNPKSLSIESFKAVNMLGQVVLEYPVHSSEKKIMLPSTLASGVYVCSIVADGTEVSKKVVISK